MDNSNDPNLKRTGLQDVPTPLGVVRVNIGPSGHVIEGPHKGTHVSQFHPMRPLQPNDSGRQG